MIVVFTITTYTFNEINLTDKYSAVQLFFFLVCYIFSLSHFPLSSTVHLWISDLDEAAVQKQLRPQEHSCLNMSFWLSLTPRCKL